KGAKGPSSSNPGGWRRRCHDGNLRSFRGIAAPSTGPNARTKAERGRCPPPHLDTTFGGHAAEAQLEVANIVASAIRAILRMSVDRPRSRRVSLGARAG